MATDDNSVKAEILGGIAGALAGATVGGMSGDALTRVDQKAQDKKRAAYVEKHPDILARLSQNGNRSPEDLANQAVKEWQKNHVEMSASQVKETYEEYLAFFTAKQKADRELEKSFIEDRAKIEKDGYWNSTIGAAGGIFGMGIGAGAGAGVAGAIVETRRRRKEREETEPEEDPSPSRSQ